MKGFKYQITVSVLLCKHKQNGGIGYAPVYCNSAAVAVINSDEYDLSNPFKKFYTE